MKKTEASNNTCNKQEEITTDFIVEIECGASEKINEVEKLKCSDVATYPKDLFTGFPKIARLNRKVIVTEKIDGTNAQIKITEDGRFLVGSRNRWITPEDDNFGFAAWAHDNKTQLMNLGVGSHFGEWWGGGIQRGYGLKQEKRFSLFNVQRWCLAGGDRLIIPNENPHTVKYQDYLPECCGLVPVLGVGDFNETNKQIERLKREGSQASLGYMNPEGVVAFHMAGNVAFKVTIDKDEEPKSKTK